MSETNTIPKNYLDHQADKANLFMETGMLTSELVVAGTVPNPEALHTGFPEYLYQAYYLKYDEGQFIFIDDNADTQKSIFTPEQQALVMPTFDVILQDFMARTGQTDLDQIYGRGFFRSGVIEPGGAAEDTETPHTDHEPEQTSETFIYVASVGPSTKVYEGSFDHDAETVKRIASAYLELDQPELDLPEFIIQQTVNEAQAQPTELPDNQIVLLDSQTIHQAPDGDESLRGKPRAVFQVQLSTREA